MLKLCVLMVLVLTVGGFRIFMHGRKVMPGRFHAENAAESQGEPKGFSRVSLWTVNDKFHEKQLHDFVKVFCGSMYNSTTSIKRAIRRGIVTVNGNSTTIDHILYCGDVVESFVRSKPGNFYSCGNEFISVNGDAKEDIDFCNFRVVWEDNYFAIVNKPQGVPVFPCKDNPFQTNDNSVDESNKEYLELSLQSLILGRLTQPLDGVTNQPLRRPQIVHRLDRGTGGLVVVAKTRPALTGLTSAFADRLVQKQYRAMVVGKLEGSGSITHALDGKACRTDWSSVMVSESQTYGFVTTLDVSPHTGRNHQIRR